MKAPRQIDLAWMGGFFDGEGSITLTVMQEKYIRLEVTCSQKVQLPLTVYEAHFGGNTHGYKPKRGDICYAWKIYGEAAVKFLITLLPYMVVKGDDAREVIDIWQKHDIARAKKRHEDRRAIRNEIHRIRNEVIDG